MFDNMILGSDSLSDSTWQSHFKRTLIGCILFVTGSFHTLANEPIAPIAPNPYLNNQKFSLGRMLFNDTRLSEKLGNACHTCHDTKLGGDDGISKPAGLAFNTPTVLNASKNYYLGWLGKFNELTPHTTFILNNPKVMGTNWPVALAAFDIDPNYSRSFSALYQGVSKEAVIDALQYYVRNLIVPSPFDAYLLGDQDAISSDAKLGYKHFKDYGCISCHQGENVGGNSFQTLGVFHSYKGVNGNYQVKRLRVPSLRNVARTSPYLHDGSINSLTLAITTMAEFQLGQTLTSTEVNQIKAFLESLSSIDETIPHEKN